MKKDNELKEVIAVYANGKFKQFLMKSEVRLLLKVMADHSGIIGTELVKISTDRYKIEFGK